MKMTHKKSLFLTLVTAGLLLTGCGSDAKKASSAQPHKKVQRAVYQDWTWDVGSEASLNNGRFTLYNTCYSGLPGELKHFQVFLDTKPHQGYTASGTWEISGADYLVEDGVIYQSLSDSQWRWKRLGNVTFKVETINGYKTIWLSDNKYLANNINSKQINVSIETYDSAWNGEYTTVVLNKISVSGKGGGVVAPPAQANGAKKLLAPEDGKIYFAAYTDLGADENGITGSKIRELQNIAGKNIAWAYVSDIWKDGIKYPKEDVHTMVDNNLAPFIRLIPRSDDGENDSSEDDRFTMQRIINGDFDSDLRAWARAAKADNIPLMLDFAMEMNGFWFPWSGLYAGAGTKDGYGDSNYPDGPERYRDAYRHIIDIFRAEGAKNITWFFHPDIQRLPDVEWNSPKYYYPGDDYIDWIGLSIYGAQFDEEDWREFRDNLTYRGEDGSGKTQAELIQEITHANKPIAILETGVTDFRDDGSKAAWFEKAFATIKNNPYLEFKAFSYWHENWSNSYGSRTTLKIDSSSASQRAFRRLIQDDTFISKAVFSK